MNNKQKGTNVLAATLPARQYHTVVYCREVAKGLTASSKCWLERVSTRPSGKDPQFHFLFFAIF